MYKILVISDTHHRIKHVLDLIKHMKDLDHIIHLGDLVEDAKELKRACDLPFDMVSGNCDFYERKIPSEKLLTICNKRFFITHGHDYHVKYGYEQMEELMEMQKADVALFGHTHIPYVEWIGESLLMNPGSISQPRNFQHPSYGIIQIDDEGLLHASLKEYKKSF